MAGRSTGFLTFPGRERRVPLRGRITRQISACCIARLLVLATEHYEQPIIIHIDSPGGPIADSLPIISTMNGIKCPIATFCSREASNSAALIAARGVPGYRTAAPNAKFAFKPMAGSGQKLAGDHRFLQVFTELLSQATRKPQAEVLSWLTEGMQFTAQQAVDNGLIDSLSAKPILPVISRDGAVT